MYAYYEQAWIVKLDL